MVPPPGDLQTRSVFVDPSGRRASRLRWLGRGMALAGLAYLVILGGSFARAPWAPHLSLPGIGSITPPALQAAPPSLGAQALSTPAPVVAAAPAGKSPTPGPPQGGGAGSRTRPPTTAAKTSGGTATTTAPAVAQTTTTTFAPPGQARRSTTTTTTASGSTPTSTRGRPATTTTTNLHRRGTGAQP